MVSLELLGLGGLMLGVGAALSGQTRTLFYMVLALFLVAILATVLIVHPSMQTVGLSGSLYDPSWVGMLPGVNTGIASFSTSVGVDLVIWLAAAPNLAQPAYAIRVDNAGQTTVNLYTPTIAGRGLPTATGTFEVLGTAANNFDLSGSGSSLPILQVWLSPGQISLFGVPAWRVAQNASMSPSQFFALNNYGTFIMQYASPTGPVGTAPPCVRYVGFSTSQALGGVSQEIVNFTFLDNSGPVANVGVSANQGDTAGQRTLFDARAWNFGAPNNSTLTATFVHPSNVSSSTANDGLVIIASSVPRMDTSVDQSLLVFRMFSREVSCPPGCGLTHLCHPEENCGSYLFSISRYVDGSSTDECLAWAEPASNNAGLRIDFAFAQNPLNCDRCDVFGAAVSGTDCGSCKTHKFDCDKCSSVSDSGWQNNVWVPFNEQFESFSKTGELPSSTFELYCRFVEGIAEFGYVTRSVENLGPAVYNPVLTAKQPVSFDPPLQYWGFGVVGQSSACDRDRSEAILTNITVT